MKIRRKFSFTRVLVEKIYLAIHGRRAKVNVRLHPQMVIFSSDYIGAEINLGGVYELETLLDTESFLKFMGVPIRGTVLDIGANIGNHAVFFANRASRVIAFEPNPRAYELLTINTRGRNVVNYPVGLSDSNAELDFQIRPVNIGASAIVPTPMKGGMRVPVRRYDDIEDLAGINVTLIKIDVEGHELQALQGAQRLLERCRPTILLEQLRGEFHLGSSPTLDYLRSMGYEFHVRHRNFELGRGLRTLSRALRSVFGERVQFQRMDQFVPANYDLIVALPRASSLVGD